MENIEICRRKDFSPLFKSRKSRKRFHVRRYLRIRCSEAVRNFCDVYRINSTGVNLTDEICQKNVYSNGKVRLDEDSRLS